MSNAYSAEDLTEMLNRFADAAESVELADARAQALVPLAHAIRAATTFATAVDAEIQLRVLNEIEVPGASLKDVVTHRKWNDAKTAAELAFAQFGLRAFKLDSPAGVEKLGAQGKSFVAVASTKPPGGKKAAY